MTTSKTTPQVGILMGSDSDWPVMQKAARTLRDLEVRWEARVLSAHRNPHDCAAYAEAAADRGIQVLICGAGMAAHLAGVVAAHTILPVIAVPCASKRLDGLDALLAMVQMPKGVPVATVAIDGAQNAALLAVQMMALSDQGLRDKLTEHKRDMAAAGLAKKLPPLEG